MTQVEGKPPSQFTLTISTTDSEIVVRANANELQDELPVAQQFELGRNLTTESTSESPGELREKAQHILEAAGEWKTSKKLANDAGYSLDADFYKLLKELKENRYLEHSKNGYRRSEL